MSLGWKYKCTKLPVMVGDIVELSARYRKEFGYANGRVVSLQGFISVKLPNGEVVDFDARSLSLISRSEIV